MMNLKSFYLFTFMAITASACGQDEKLSVAFKSTTIQKMVELINDNYVFEDVARETGRTLEAKLKSGEFDTVKDEEEFAAKLTQVVQAVNHDKHMRIRVKGASGSQRGSSSGGSAGFQESKILDGNIGYLDVRGFYSASVASSTADEHMKKLEGVNALIIDMRYNGGGSPDMVQYLCSYFFADRIHLNSLYFRPENRTTEFWTEEVKGKKMPDVPLYILTSTKTFSGAEEFCYNMQTRKRATLVGEITGGGANPGGVFSINDKLTIFIPTGRAINPVTGINWEGTGVVPEVKTSADEAFVKAIELAQKPRERK